MCETNIAKRLWTVFEEGQRFVPESTRKQVGFNARPYALSLNMTDTKTNTPAPFVHPGIKDELSHHQQISLRICQSGGQKIVQELNALMADTPAGSFWYPNLSFFLDAACKTVHIQIFSDQKNHVVGRYQLKDGFDDFCKALRQISLALKISRPGPTRSWAGRGTGVNTPTVQAADATSASILVCALVLEFQFSDVLQGKTPPPDIVEIADMDSVKSDLKSLLSQFTFAEKEISS